MRHKIKMINFACDMTERIVMIGAGNVAWSLARALAAEHDIVQVYSRHRANADALAEAVHCPAATDDLGQITTEADTYVISVKDDAIAAVASAIPDHRHSLWLHTSGTKPLSLLTAVHTRCGVLYPMQSFSKALPVDFNDVPVFVEGNTPDTQEAAMRLARSISAHVEVADSARRARLHIGAVMACNFTNHLWTLTAEVLGEAGIDFKVMLPLLRTTVAKLDRLSPAESQTGPAARGDTAVTAAHEQMLSGRKQEIYRILTQSIIETTNKQTDNKI